MPARNFTFEIKEHLGTIASHESTGWNRELNIISWNGGAPKYDIRDWDEYHIKMSRGITLSQWEMRKLVDLYVSRNNERAVSRGRANEERRNALRNESFRQHQEVSGANSSAERMEPPVELRGAAVLEDEEDPLMEPSVEEMKDTTPVTDAEKPKDAESAENAESTEEPF